MSKELLENLLIEFDEMGYEPTTLCDTKREVESFRRRLKQALDYLKSIDNSNPSEALEEIKQIEFYVGTIIGLKFIKGNDVFSEAKKQDYEIFEIKCEKIKQALIKAQEDKKKAEALRELIKNHIEFVVEEDRCYFKIKNSKGNEKSFTSYTMLDFWKEVLNNE